MRIRKVAVQGAADGKGYVNEFTVSLKDSVYSSWKAFQQAGEPKVIRPSWA